jgi:hypothetical protein
LKKQPLKLVFHVIETGFTRDRDLCFTRFFTTVETRRLSSYGLTLKTTCTVPCRVRQTRGLRGYKLASGGGVRVREAAGHDVALQVEI